MCVCGCPGCGGLGDGALKLLPHSFDGDMCLTCNVGLRNCCDAALGAAFRAAHAVCCRERGSFVPFQDAISTNSAPLRHVASPAPDECAVYDASLQRLAEYEAKLLGR